MTFYRLQYLILRRDGDGMGVQWPAAANASFEWARENGVAAGVAMPAPYAAPFREMIAAPQVVHRLEWIMGAGFCTGSDFGVRTLHRGEGRQLIHAGLNYKSNEYHYVLTEGGRSYAEAVNVSFQLSDSCTGGGGLTLVSALTSQSVKIVLHLIGPSLVQVPGSHKSSYLLPTSIDGTEDLAGSDGSDGYGRVPQCLVHPTTQAGDIIIFSGFGTGHGVGNWASDHERRLVIASYLSRSLDAARGKRHWTVAPKL